VTEWAVEVLAQTPVAVAVLAAVQMMLRHQQRVYERFRKAHEDSEKRSAEVIRDSSEAIRECARAHGEASARFSEATQLIRQLAAHQGGQVAG